MGELRPTDVRLTEMAARLRLTYIRDHLVELVETAAKEPYDATRDAGVRLQERGGAA